jgi:hypothetical protein
MKGFRPAKVQLGTGRRGSLIVQVTQAISMRPDFWSFFMRKAMIATIAAALLGLATAPAGAMQGCGPGWARGPYGRCHPIGAAPVYRPAPMYRPPAAYGYYPHRCWWRDGVRVCR